MRRITCIALLSTCLLTACGGGGGEETARPAAVAPNPPAPPPVVDTPAHGAAGIQVPQGFDFDNAQAMQIVVRDPVNLAPRTYLTVCRDRVGSAQADYDRCVLKTPVIAGELDRRIRLPNDVDTLTATLWTLQPAAAIKTVRWYRSNTSSNTWIVE